MFNGAKLALGAYVIYVLVSQQPVIEAKREQKARLEEALANAQKIEVQIRTDLSMADSVYYIERAAKELGMVKPGDRVFIDIRR